MEVTVLMVNRGIMRGYTAQDLLSWNCLSTHTEGINLMLVDKQMHRHGHGNSNTIFRRNSENSSN